MAGKIAAPRVCKNKRIELQSVPQFPMLRQSNRGLTERPILISHQAQHSQQLRLRELSFAEFGPILRQRRLADLQRNPSESNQPNFWHARQREAPEQHQVRISETAPHNGVLRMSTEPNQL